MPPFRTYPSLAGADKLPLPWDLQARKPPPGFELPYVPTPPELKELDSEFANREEWSAERVKAEREKRLQIMRDNEIRWLESTMEMQDNMDELSIATTNSAMQSRPDDDSDMLPPFSDTEPTDKVVSRPPSGHLNTRWSIIRQHDLSHDENMVVVNVDNPPTAPQRPRRRADLFEIPESDPIIPDQDDNVDQHSPEDDLPSVLTPSTTDLEATICGLSGSSVIPQKRKAENDGRVWVDTRLGRMPIVQMTTGKVVERLLQRGKHEKRIWFLCGYVGKSESQAEVLFQTDLKKVKKLANMIKDWEKQARNLNR